jgi:hypothetical protein
MVLADTVIAELPLNVAPEPVPVLELLNVTDAVVAFAVVAVVAVAALPPILREEAVPVRPVPAPAKPVADRTPVEGTNDSLVEEIFQLWFPLLAAYHVG